jgi:hypothetical protein
LALRAETQNFALLRYLLTVFGIWRTFHYFSMLMAQYQGNKNKTISATCECDNVERLHAILILNGSCASS